MKSLSDIQVLQKKAGDDSGFTGADSATAVCTVAAIADEFHVLDSIHYSYDEANAGSVAVTFGGVTVFSEDTTATGPDEIIFPRGLYTGTVNEEMVVTIGASVGDKAKCNITYR